MATVPRMLSIEDLAIPAVSLLIAFLAYSSQILFYYIEPGPLTRKEAAWFNALVLAIWWSYIRACKVDAGPKGWVGKAEEGEESNLKKGVRWCRKCEAVKPPRAHHCKKCQRCIPKMDHHCPWTTNCVSHTTFPHFIRFVFYADLSMSILAYHLFVRGYIIWESRSLPAYLGPPVWTMAHLFTLLFVNGLTLFALGILLIRAVYSLVINTTMIESWEIERHEALVERSRKTGGFVYANGGQRMRVEKQEFPYDIGFWQNICQGMGSSNVIVWFVPFAPTPSIKIALDWEVNGFEDESKTWPPPDPDKMPRTQRNLADERGEIEYKSVREEVEAFKSRQRKDLERWDTGKESNVRVARNEKEEYRSDESEEEVEAESDEETGFDGKAGWTNSDGDRLGDFGVDEEADTELLAEDDIPLGELLRRRKVRTFEQ